MFWLDNFSTSSGNLMVATLPVQAIRTLFRCSESKILPLIMNKNEVSLFYTWKFGKDTLDVTINCADWFCTNREIPLVESVEFECCFIIGNSSAVEAGCFGWIVGL